MDYIEEIFTKHYSDFGALEIENGKSTRKALMDLSDFRAVVKDIEADHLKKVCQME